MREEPLRLITQKAFLEPIYPEKNWRYEAVLADTYDVSRRNVEISINVSVPPPLPNHGQALQLAALLIARDVINERIEWLQSPGSAQA